MSRFVRVLLASIVLASILACGHWLGKSLEIDVDEMPVYPNAQNVTREGPLQNGIREVYTWSLTSSDAPESVWQFYKDEMGRKWGFHENCVNEVCYLASSTCYFYTLDMSSTPAEGGAYQIVIELAKEPCR